jgi:uncharacterized protein (TIGR03067 family)
MRKRLLLVLAVGLLAAADEKEDQKELKKFQGTWVMVSGEIDGKKVAEEHVKKSKLVYEGEKIAVHTPHQSDKPIEATLKKLDPSKKPKEMHWVRKNGPGAGTTMMAIYEFLDDDQYRICFDPSGKGVPKEFAAKEGTGYILHVWKREKK